MSVVLSIDPTSYPLMASSDVSVIHLHHYAVICWPKHVEFHDRDRVDPHVVKLLKRFLGSMDDSSQAYQGAGIFGQRVS
jgi:hypothetical protein